ncbi:MAG TPA: AAA family ATPase [Pseudomonadota bacterium]|nr:AAA family ATPase [Pseudomonadota bacterium]
MSPPAPAQPPSPAGGSTPEASALPSWSHPRYVLVQPIGQGGMGTVYRARDRLTGAWVALKRVRWLANEASLSTPLRSSAPDETLPPDSAMSAIDARIVHAGSPTPFSGEFQPVKPYLRSLSEPSAQPVPDTQYTRNQSPLALALAQEFRLLASLRHRNIVSVFDYGFDESGQPFFTMELVPDTTPFLQACHSRDLAGRVTLLLDVLQALSYLHRRGVLHRDLKPSNVVMNDGRVVVLDFGLATLRSLTERGGGRSGTLHYMAPELLAGGTASEASDLYSLGVMATQALTGRLPFAGERSEILVNRVLNDEPDLWDEGLPRAVQRVLERLLARDPKERFADAAQVGYELSVAAGLALPQETVELRESYLQAASFVGRESELATLRTALSAAMRGGGGLWLIGGESGVGKSRLLEELRTLALVRGARVERGQAITEAHSAYQIFLDVLRSLSLSLKLSSLEERTLLSVLPELPTLLGHEIAPPPELEPHAARARLQTVLSELLLRSTTPTVLILEDLHWAAVESRELLRRLLPVLPERPLLILASYRDDESPQLPRELPGARLLPLARLGPRDVDALVTSMLGPQAGRSELRGWLRQQTEGNPFFLVEIVRALAEEAGSLARIDLGRLQSRDMPSGLGAVIARRLSHLPAWTLPALRLAAVVGRRIDRDLMRGLMSVDESEVDRWLATCADAAVLAVHDQHWQFAHDKLREGLLLALPAAELRGLHRQVADELERAAAGSPEQAAVLAFHLQQAGDPQRAYRYALLAGEVAIGRGSLREADEQLGQALRIEAQAVPTLLSRVRLRRLLGQVQLSLGHIDECMRTTEEGLRQVGMPLPVSSSELALSLLRNLLTQGAHRLDERGWLGRSLSQHFDPSLSPELLHEAQWLFVVHAEVALYLFSDQRLFYCALAAANVADQLNDIGQRITSYAALAYTAGMVSLPQLSAMYLQQADALRQGQRGTSADFKFLRVRASLWISQGRLREAESDLWQADRIANEIGDTVSRLVALQQILWCRVFRQRFGTAEDALSLFVHLADSQGHSQFAARARVLEAQQLLDAGHAADAQRRLMNALSQIRATRDLTFELHAVQLHARAALAQGQWETARADSDVLLSIFSESPVLNYGVISAAEGLVDVSFELLVRAQPLLRRQRRRRLQQALAVLERLGKHHVIARPALLSARARLLRIDGGSESQARALEQQAQTLADSYC